MDKKWKVADIEGVWPDLISESKKYKENTLGLDVGPGSRFSLVGKIKAVVIMSPVAGGIMVAGLAKGAIGAALLGAAPVLVGLALASAALMYIENKSYQVGSDLANMLAAADKPDDMSAKFAKNFKDDGFSTEGLSADTVSLVDKLISRRKMVPETAAAAAGMKK
jgi:hypothetical protein